MWQIPGLFLLIVSVCWGQRHAPTVNPATPEGQLLQSIGTQEDPAKKIELLDQFVSRYPNHQATAWVLAELVSAHAATGDSANAAAAGEKLLAKDPEDLGSAVVVLKSFEGAPNSAAVLKWSKITSDLARAELAKPKPANAADVDDWVKAQDYAKQVDAYSDYALLNQTIKAADAQEAGTLADELARRSPESPYLSQAQSAAFVALRKSGQEGPAVALAEKLLVKDPNNEEMLLIVADNAMKAKQNDKTITYSTRLVEAVRNKPKPEQMTEADWQKRRDTLLGVGNWMAGVTYATQSNFAQADKALREALPLVTDEQMKAAALFHLGVANFRLGESASNMGRIKEALIFSQQSAAIKSPYTAGAQKNVNAIRTKYRVGAK